MKVIKSKGYLCTERYLIPLEPGLFEGSAEEINCGEFRFIPNKIMVMQAGWCIEF